LEKHYPEKSRHFPSGTDDLWKRLRSAFMWKKLRILSKKSFSGNLHISTSLRNIHDPRTLRRNIILIFVEIGVGTVFEPLGGLSGGWVA
jgi:hypothetical protein